MAKLKVKKGDVWFDTCINQIKVFKNGTWHTIKPNDKVYYNGVWNPIICTI